MGIKKITKPTFLIAMSILLLFSCKSDDDVSATVELNNEVNEFVWRAMNSWYLFYDDVPNLSDDRDDNIDNFYTFLNGFASPEALFENIKIDDFSILVDDYDELGGGLSAVYNSFGYDFILYEISATEYVGQIRFVFPGSQAEIAGLKRGDMFTEINGQAITDANIESILLSSDSFRLTMAEITRNGQDGYSVTPTGQEINIVSTSLDRTAIWAKNIVTVGADKVGYLMYSNFESSLHEELNQVFGEFKAAGVTELVLDLRYNPGGSVVTSTYLNSMIYSDDVNVFMGSLDFNDKHPNAGSDLFFQNTVEFFDEDFTRTGEQEPLNSLGLDRVFILTSSSTASASEFVINALDPFIDVIIIGDTTVGKNLGSIALYDNPPNYTRKEGANDNHKYGIQPIVSVISNSVGFSDYSSGFAPDIEIREIDFLDDLRPLGEPNEQFFAEALQIICPSCRFSNEEYTPMFGIKPIFEGIQFHPNYQKSDLTGFELQ